MPGPSFDSVRFLSNAPQVHWPIHQSAADPAADPAEMPDDQEPWFLVEA